MNLIIKTPLAGYDFAPGDEVQNPEELFGPALTAYLVEVGAAEVAPARQTKPETATHKPRTEKATTK